MNQATDEAVVEQTEEQRDEQQVEQTAEEKDAEAGFAAGFARVSGTEPEKTDATEETDTDTAPDTGAETAAQASTAATPAATAPVPETVTLSKDDLQALNTRLRNVEGKFGGLNSKLDSVLATAKAAATDAGGAAPTESQVKAALSNPEAWKQLKEDFPDWAGPVEAELSALNAKIEKASKSVDVVALKKDVAGTVNARISEGVDEAEERAFLRLKHPTWKQTVKTKEFADWFKTQPAGVQALGESRLADDAIKVFDSYDAHQKKVAQAAQTRQRNQQRLERTVTPTGTSSPPAAGISDDDAFARGFKRVRRASS